MNRVAREWASFRERVLVDITDPIQVQEMRRAFYAGAWACFCIVTGEISPGDEPTEADMTMMDDLERELNAFADAKKMLRHRDNVAGNQGEDTDLAILREKLGRELADVVIYADLVAASQGIDLAAVVRDTFNRKSEQIGSSVRLGPQPAGLLDKLAASVLGKEPRQ